MSKQPPKPASANSGYVFALPETQHPLTSDPFYTRLLSWYLPEHILREALPELTQFAGESVSAEVRGWMSNASQQEPYVRTYDVWGARYDVDRLVTSHGWKQLRKWGASNGIVAIGYEQRFGKYKRIVQHAKNYFFTPCSAVTSCPLSMSDGAARLLSQLLPGLPPSHPFHEVFRRLMSREDAWTSGQWMTERTGGSDVQSSETWATYSPLPDKSGPHGRLDQGDYLVSGFKFFSSATDADVAVLLAKTEGGKLSAFLAPLTTTAVDAATGEEKLVSNGVRIHRLKNKLGTKQLPTAELEIDQMRAHLVGPLDRGVASISHILNVTRAYAFVGTAAGWRRSLSLAKSFARARTMFGQPLWTLPLHLRTLAEVELKLRGALHLAFFTTALMSFTENGFPEADAVCAVLPRQGQEANAVLRVLTATAKAVISKNGVMGVQECMEAMGGVGYMDEPDEPENIARAFRDMNVNTIWEGTTNVLSSDVTRQLLKGDNLDLVGAWLHRAIGGVEEERLRSVLGASWAALARLLQGYKDGGGMMVALGNGRRVMFSVAWICDGLLLALDAQRDGDEVGREAARRWILDGEGGVGPWLIPGVGAGRESRREDEDEDEDGDGEERARRDCLLVFGRERPRESKM